MTASDSSTLLIPSNKFYPPHINQAQSLLRENLLRGKLALRALQNKVIIVEAQAGQGKTTLVAQFLDFHQVSYLWYQVGPEDSDPVFMLSSLLMNLSLNLPGFTSPQLETILADGSVGPLDLTRCANILLQDLDIFQKSDLYLVFDDLHLIEFGALTNKLFEHLIDTSPPQIHFILVTRQQIEIKGKTIRNGAQISYLDTDDLALDDLEIEELYNAVLKKTISREDAIRIQKVTNGWIMGILLASHPISGRAKFWQNGDADVLPRTMPTGHMLDYFEDEIFAQIPGHLNSHFLKLSFLQEIPADLATRICGIADFGTILDDMTRDNYFIYRLDDQRQVFRFHHFFQEFLQEKGRTLFTTDQIAEIYSCEADYYLDHEMTEKALTCYKNAGNLMVMQDIIREKGMELIIRNRTFTILTLLQTLPESTLHQYPWLTLYAGLLRIDYVPQTTLPYFEVAQEQFAGTGENMGELIALSQMIYYHFVISGQYRLGAQLLDRTCELLENNRETLPPPILIMAARNLASGYCFFVADMEKARHYIDLATTLATRHNIHNFIASSRFIQGYIELLCGNRAKYLREAEICFTLFRDPLVGESNRLTMRVMNLCYLSMTGDHHNFQLQQQALQNSINQNVIEQTVAAPYLYVWGSSALYSVGRTQEALALLERGRGITATASIAHMYSQILQWQAFGLALTGYNEEAEAKIEESISLRKEAGGPFYTAFNNIIAGAVYTRLKRFDSAHKHLERGLAIAQTIPSTYLTICAVFNLAHYKYEAHGPDNALEELETGLSAMKINGFNHFWSWEPIMMRKLLAEAVKRDIETSFAQSIARSRLGINFAESGTSIPLLTFKLLDNFEISVADTILFRAKDLTPFQRELLGLLVTAKGQRIPQEKIQLELWPDSSPENARKSFDTLLTRLRKLISPHLPIPIKNYLFLQKSILCLTNYDIDALNFLEAARTGLAHSKNSDWWQAYNSFQHALALWKGAMPEDTFQSEQILSFNDTLSHLLAEIATVWANNLAESGRHDTAIQLLEQILKINYLEEEITIQLYRLYLKNKNPLKARETLGRYHKALLNAEYSEDEADAYINEIVRSSADLRQSS